MSEKQFLNNYEKNIEKMININQSSELTGQDSAKKSENEEKKNIPENSEILAESIGEPLFDEYMNDMLQNRDIFLNDVVDESALQEASKILSNKEQYNSQLDGNSFDSNSNTTKFIFHGLKMLN